ncbi:hypothetical protein [Alysiella sp.]|nr:hypothetical protein [Alysiella sp.]
MTPLVAMGGVVLKQRMDFRLPEQHCHRLITPIKNNTQTVCI